MTRLTSTQINGTGRMVTLWAAALALMLAVPTTARAEDCNARYMQCMMELSMSTECLHDYVDCLRGVIRGY